MKKIVIHSPGGHEKLCLEEHPSVKLEEGQARVQIKASGVNYADIAVRWGIYESAKKLVGWPITPGFEFSGVVSETLGNSKFKIGDEVFGVSFFNGYANEVVVPEHQLFHKPKELSMVEAAGFLATHMTAYHALFQNFILRKGSKVLVHSAAGGVGSALLQLLKVHECFTVGVVGREVKREIALKYGADKVIAKEKENLWKKVEEYVPEGFEAVLDANGVETLKESFNHLAPTGKLVSYGFHSMLPKKGGKINWPKLVYHFLRTPRFSPLEMTNENKSLITFNLSFLFEKTELLHECVDNLTLWLSEGKVIPPKVTEYSYKNVTDAHRDIESGNTTGKLVLVWD